MCGTQSLRRGGGFTLVEILIVVIILGILAAIVIPQFSNASKDARHGSLSSTLRTVRGQIEFYMVQHGDAPPTLSGSDWASLTQASTWSGKTVGPYLQRTPINSLNGYSDVLVVAADAAGGDAVAAPNTGFVYNPTNGKMWATNSTADRVYNEVTPSDPNN